MDIAAIREHMKRLAPPDDLHDAAAWDTYWVNNIQAGWVAALSDIFCDDKATIAALRENRLQSVLCVGSGLSLEPHRLVAAGFDVTALDLSPYALGLVERYCALHPPAPRLVVGDLTDPTVCPGPYDVIIERRTLQLFAGSDRAPAMQAVANRLAPRGIFFSHCHDGWSRSPAQPQHWTRPWFEENGWDIWWGGPGTLRERTAWLILSTG
jgi:SAM-dependent methyltransferase